MLAQIRLLQPLESIQSTDHRPVDLRERAAPGQGHSHLELIAENLHDPAHAGRASCGQTENVRPPNEDSLGAERESFQYVRSSAYAPIHQQWHSAGNLLRDRWQNR